MSNKEKSWTRAERRREVGDGEDAFEYEVPQVASHPSPTPAAPTPTPAPAPRHLPPVLYACASSHDSGNGRYFQIAALGGDRYELKRHKHDTVAVMAGDFRGVIDYLESQPVLQGRTWTKRGRRT